MLRFAGESRPAGSMLGLTRGIIGRRRTWAMLGFASYFLLLALLGSRLANGIRWEELGRGFLLARRGWKVGMQIRAALETGGRDGTDATAGITEEEGCWLRSIERLDLAMGHVPVSVMELNFGRRSGPFFAFLRGSWETPSSVQLVIWIIIKNSMI